MDFFLEKGDRAERFSLFSSPFGIPAAQEGSFSQAAAALCSWAQELPWPLPSRINVKWQSRAWILEASCQGISLVYFAASR